jgi:hypothetical protein
MGARALHVLNLRWFGYIAPSAEEGVFSSFKLFPSAFAIRRGRGGCRHLVLQSLGNASHIRLAAQAKGFHSVQNCTQSHLFTQFVLTGTHPADVDVLEF